VSARDRSVQHLQYPFRMIAPSSKLIEGVANGGSSPICAVRCGAIVVSHRITELPPPVRQSNQVTALIRTPDPGALTDRYSRSTPALHS
jgi:hypothetical protein